MGTLAGGLGCFPLDYESSHPQSHAPRPRPGIRRLVRVGKREAPSSIQRDTSGAPHAGAAPKCISGRTSYLRVRLAFHRYPQLIRTFCNMSRFGPPQACSARFSLAMGRSPGFGSIRDDCSPFRTRFRSGSACPWLSLAARAHSSAHSTKGTPSQDCSCSDRPEAHGFRICFTPLAGVLFTVPSRYWFAIGRGRYSALGRGRPSFPPGSSCPAVLTQRSHERIPGSPYGALTRSGGPFQRPSESRYLAREGPAEPSGSPVQPRDGIAGRLCRRPGLGSSPFARRY